MKKISKKILAVVMCLLVILPTGSMGAFAADSTVMKANSSMVFVEKLVGGLFDAIIGGFGTFMKSHSLDS